jgi:hypothetical protein
MTCRVGSPIAPGGRGNAPASVAQHALQRVQRDRSARVRAFCGGIGHAHSCCVSDWTELPLTRLGEPLQQAVKDVRPVKLKGMLPSPLGHHDPFVIGHGDG